MPDEPMGNWFLWPACMVERLVACCPCEDVPAPYQCAVVWFTNIVIDGVALPDREGPAGVDIYSTGHGATAVNGFPAGLSLGVYLVANLCTEEVGGFSVEGALSYGVVQFAFFSFGFLFATTPSTIDTATGIIKFHIEGVDGIGRNVSFDVTFIPYPPADCFCGSGDCGEMSVTLTIPACMANYVLTPITGTTYTDPVDVPVLLYWNARLQCWVNFETDPNSTSPAPIGGVWAADLGDSPAPVLYICCDGSVTMRWKDCVITGTATGAPDCTSIDIEFDSTCGDDCDPDDLPTGSGGIEPYIVVTMMDRMRLHELTAPFTDEYLPQGGGRMTFKLYQVGASTVWAGSFPYWAVVHPPFVATSRYVRLEIDFDTSNGNLGIAAWDDATGDNIGLFGATYDTVITASPFIYEYNASSLLTTSGALFDPAQIFMPTLRVYENQLP